MWKTKDNYVIPMNLNFPSRFLRTTGQKGFNQWAPRKLNLSFLSDSEPNNGRHKFRKTFHYVAIHPPTIFRTKHTLNNWSFVALPFRFIYLLWLVLIITQGSFRPFILIYFWFNCSFSPLTFSKLRFWPLRKKLQNSPLSFATVAVLAPKADIDSVYADVAP